MTNGYGAMPDYSAQLAPEDRWAVAAYIRALQLSQNATAADVPSGAKVDSLADIAVSEGYDASFAGPWPMPVETNVQAIQPGRSSSSGSAGAADESEDSKSSRIKAPEGNAVKPTTPSGGN